MAYKPEHVVDLESGAIVSAVVHPADQGDTKTLASTLLDAQAKLGAVREADASKTTWWRIRATTVGRGGP